MPHTYDIIMLAVLVLTTLFGLWKGMAWQIASLASLVVSYIVAMQFSGVLAPYISDHEPWNRYIAILILYLVTSLAIWVGFRLVAGMIDRVRLKEFDRQMGALLGLAKGCLLCLVITFFAVTLSEGMRQSVLDSRSGKYIAVAIQKAAPAMPEEVRDRWGKYVDELDQQLQQDAPGEQPLEQTVADLLNDPLGSDADKPLGERLSGEIRDHFSDKADRQIDSGFGLLEEQVDRLDQGVRGVTDRIESGLNQGMGTIDDGINSVNDGIHSVSDGIHSMQNEVDSRVKQGLDALDLSHWLSEPEGTSRLVALPGYRVNGDEVLKIRQGPADRYGSTVDGLYRIASDGTVDLGSHGKVAVAGRTLRDVETQIERQLGGSDVSLGVAAAEREVYYVIAGEPGQGGGAWRVRSTGNETIEDAIRGVGTAPQTIEKIWMVHPSPGGVGTGVPVPVQWDAARQQASPNYRITPGDAVFVTEKNSPASASVDNWVGAWRQWLRR